MALSWDQVGTKLGLSWDEVYNVLTSCKEALNINDLMNIFAWANRSKFRNKYITPLINEGLIEMTIPDKPRSSNQKYRISAKGKELLNKID